MGTMTDEQIQMLRRLIQDEIEVAGIDGMEHGVWGFMDSQLDKRWKQFQESFNPPDISTIGSDLLDAFHDRAINSKKKNDTSSK
jgi:hypothetical protein